ncbi:MAG: hypothetical protein HDR88_09690 [Bacteroides sp.]|nr:hypothetical protein [Bacteroides sp.]MBD5357258.1 hypothetical protein [Bacteroides sp.]
MKLKIPAIFPVSSSKLRSKIALWFTVSALLLAMTGCSGRSYSVTILICTII